MKIIMCIEERGGILFNKRRVSSDRIVSEDILKHIKGESLWMSSYTFKLFHDFHQDQIKVHDDFWKMAENHAYCMVEEKVPDELWAKVEEVILYKWHRKYPYDLAFSCQKLEGQFDLAHTSELKGYSHKKITKEVYKR